VQQEGLFNEDSQRLLTTIAASAGTAIHTARLHAETQRRAREMSTLAEIGSDIAASRDLEPVLERIASHAKEILRVRDIAIHLLEGNTLRTRVALGKYTEEIMADTIPLGQGITGNIARTGVAEFVNILCGIRWCAPHPGTSEMKKKQKPDVRPLISRGQTIGHITVWRPHADGLFTQADLDFLISVARQTAIAIESARLYLETQRRAREMATLVEVGRDISSKLEASTALEGIARHARDLLGAGTSALFLPEPDGTTFRAITAVGEIADQLRDETISLGRGILGSIAAHKRGEIVNDTSSDPRGIKISGTEDKPDENLMAVPLLANDELKGLMAIWRSEKRIHGGRAGIHHGPLAQAVIAVRTQLFNEVTPQEYFETIFKNNRSRWSPLTTKRWSTLGTPPLKNCLATPRRKRLAGMWMTWSPARLTCTPRHPTFPGSAWTPVRTPSRPWPGAPAGMIPLWMWSSRRSRSLSRAKSRACTPSITT
jgi:GAF domain-containing protein